jgi:hypothetical protein
MAQLTGDTVDTYRSLETFLATSGRTEDQIQRIIDVSADMSVATGRDLRGTVEQLNKSFGGLAGELGESIPEIKSLTAEQLKAGGAVEVLAQRYNGLAEALRYSTDVSMKNFTNGWNEMTAAFGSIIAPVFNPMLQSLADLFSAWSKNIQSARDYRQALIDVDSVDKLRSNRASVTIAQHDYTNAEEDRVARMQELGLYGGYDKWHRIQIAQGASEKQSTIDEFNKLVDQVNNLFVPIREQARAALEKAKADLELLEPSAGSRPSSQNGKINTIGNTDLPMPPYLDPSSPLLKNIIESAGKDLRDITNAFTEGMRNGIESISREAAALALRAQGRGSDQIAENELFSQPEKIVGQAKTNAVGDIFTSLGNALGPVINQLGGMFSSLGSLQAILNPVMTIFGAMMDVIGPLINDALAPLVGILKIVGHALGVVLTPIIKWMGEVIKTIAQGILWVWNGIVDAINAVLGWAGVNLSHATLSDAVEAGQTSNSPAGNSGSSASYQAQRDIIINNYIYTPALVGEGGFQEFCLIVGRTIKSAGVLGMS